MKGLQDQPSQGDESQSRSNERGVEGLDGVGDHSPDAEQHDGNEEADVRKVGVALKDAVIDGEQCCHEQGLLQEYWGMEVSAKCQRCIRPVKAGRQRCCAACAWGSHTHWCEKRYNAHIESMWTLGLRPEPEQGRTVIIDLESNQCPLCQCDAVCITRLIDVSDVWLCTGCNAQWRSPVRDHPSMGTIGREDGDGSPEA